MVNTWTTSYFQTDGVACLFVLPQSWTDAFIPMTVSPKPKQIVRVMVGRLELLTAERERLAENAVRDLASGESARRQDAFRFLREQGRYVEPIVRRVMKTTTDDAVRTVCRRLLLTEFVTELRAAVHNAADGKRLTADPVHAPRSTGPAAARNRFRRRGPRRGRGRPGGSQDASRWLRIKHSPTIRPRSRSGRRPSRQPATTARQPAIYARRVELQLKMIGQLRSRHDRLAPRLVGRPRLCPVPVAHSDGRRDDRRAGKVPGPAVAQSSADADGRTFLAYCPGISPRWPGQAQARRRCTGRR